MIILTNPHPALIKVPDYSKVVKIKVVAIQTVSEHSIGDPVNKLRALNFSVILNSSVMRFKDRRIGSKLNEHVALVVF